jgi:hypothetical protein
MDEEIILGTDEHMTMSDMLRVTGDRFKWLRKLKEAERKQARIVDELENIHYDENWTEKQRLEHFTSCIHRRIDWIVVHGKRGGGHPIDLLVTRKELAEIRKNAVFYHPLGWCRAYVNPEEIAAEYVMMRYPRWHCVFGSRPYSEVLYVGLNKWRAEPIHDEKMVLLLFASRKKQLSLSSDLIRQLRPYMYRL